MVTSSSKIVKYFEKNRSSIWCQVLQIILDTKRNCQRKNYMTFHQTNQPIASYKQYSLKRRACTILNTEEFPFISRKYQIFHQISYYFKYMTKMENISIRFRKFCAVFFFFFFFLSMIVHIMHLKMQMHEILQIFKIISYRFVVCSKPFDLKCCFVCHSFGTVIYWIIGVNVFKRSRCTSFVSQFCDSQFGEVDSLSDF